MYVKIIVDGTEYRLNVFEVDGKLITTDLSLPKGEHTISSYKLFKDDDTLITEDDSVKQVTVNASFTKELVIAPAKKMAMGMVTTKVATMEYGYLYTKEAKKADNEVTVLISGLLGIPDDELNKYVNDPQYGINVPMTSKVKAVFSIQTYLNGKETGFQMYNYKNNEPLHLTYNKTGDHNDEYKFVIQMHLYLAGPNKVVEVNRGLNGDWTIAINGDDDLITNDDGVVEFTMFPTDDWESNATYKFTYKD